MSPRSRSLRLRNGTCHAYLQRYDPHQLVHVGGSTYCTVSMTA